VSTRSKSFWSTIPGLITGLAGILTALVGLGTLLIQIGVIGGDGDSTKTTTKPGQSVTTPGGARSDDSDAAGSGAATGPPKFTVAPDEMKLSTSEKRDTVTVSNTGTVPLRLVTEITGSGKDQFTLTKGTCGTEVPRSGSCTMTVEFEGGLAAKAELVVKASGGSSAQQVKLEGSLL
jgi:hypothetical protein